MSYTPDSKILENYAKVLINFALNSGAGIKKGECVYITTDQIAIPLAVEVYKQILKSGGNPIKNIRDDRFTLAFLNKANDNQLDFFADKFSKGLVDQMDHYVSLFGDEDPHYLKDIEPSKIMRSGKAGKPMRDWMDEKENKGLFTWTLGLYGTEAMAKEAGLSLEEYWNQIIKACFLDLEDPLTEWKNVALQIETVRTKLNNLAIDKLHIEAEGTDLWITLGEQRQWIGGSGRNIPSFEIFTSPDWRGTEGHIKFDLPLYRYGNIIEDIYLEFKEGKVVKATAGKNEHVLTEMIATEGADMIGEYSLTDKKFSRIDKFMATTLFDENFGGEFGNTHLALGKSYHDTLAGDPSKLSKEEWTNLGFNDSSVHTDIISTTNRKVTAVLKDASEKVIYKDGEFTL